MSAVGSILTNTGALTALNSIAQTSQSTNTLQNELASGLSINSPSDNPAGYITAQGFTSQLNGLAQATSNANQGVSLLQTAQSAIGQQLNVVQQLNTIAVQAANGTQTASESQSLQNLVGQLTSQVSTIANQTQFNNIALLDGTFSSQFQVGANEGQTLGLSINSTAADEIGMNVSTANSNLYKGANGSAAVTANTANTFATGALTAGTATITGSGGGTASITSTATESAASLAQAVNNVSGTTGVQAQANTVATFAITKGSAVSFSLQSSPGGTATSGAAVAVNASSATQAASEINGKSSVTGITATVDKNGNLQITQAAGENIQMTVTSGTLTPETMDANGAATGGTAVAATAGKTPGPGYALIQGQVQLQSAGGFSVAQSGVSAGAATALGVNAGSSTLDSLSNIDVSTTADASKAINVVKYALAGLNNQDGQLGATQQRLSATINNLNSTSTNATTALGVVQDANIPAVANQLTQAQIQAQSGVAALKSSTELQQTYLSLLP